MSNIVNETPKGTSLPGTTSFDVFCVKIRSRVLAVALLKNPPKYEEKTSPQKDGKITYLGSRNSWTDRYKILHVGCRPGLDHACQFLWRSVKRFGVGDGSNFGLFHWLALSPLKHSRTTVRVCDLCCCLKVDNLFDTEHCVKWNMLNCASHK